VVEKITPVVGATVGSSLLVKNLNRETEHNIQLVNPDQADPKNGKIPLTNPIGKALEGAKEGDEVKVGPNIFKILKLNTTIDMVVQGAVKVEQTVVHGDYIDDRDTIIKDSVVNKSNISGGGSSKMQELKELKEMFDSGFISKEEMEDMKKEILGK